MLLITFNTTLMKHRYLLLLSSFLFAACNRYYYKPSGINDPLFTAGGQLHASIAGSSEEDNNDHSYFMDLQLAYSPINHLGFLANYSTYNYRPFDKTVAPANAYLVEAAAGGYVVPGQGKRKFVADLYAGGGIGQMNSDIDAHLRKIFIQPGFGVRSRIVDVVFNFRFSNIRYSDINTKGYDYAYLTGNHLIDTISGRNLGDGSYTFFEPGVTLRTGYKFVKAQFQAAFAAPVSVVSWHYNGLRFTVGLHVNMEEILELGRKKNEKK